VRGMMAKAESLRSEEKVASLCKETLGELIALRLEGKQAKNFHVSTLGHLSSLLRRLSDVKQ